MAVFVGVDEAEDHVPEVARIGGQRRHPVRVADRVRVAAQVTEVLHRHERIADVAAKGLHFLNSFANAWRASVGPPDEV